MSNTIQFFHLTQIYFQTLGIWPTKPNQKYSIDFTSFLVLCTMILIIISTAAFFALEADSVDEYIHTIYISSTEFGLMLCFFVNIWKMPKISQLIKDYEQFAQKS